MEDVLDVYTYTRPYDPLRPQVCLDETSKQLVAETHTPLPSAPGRPARFDYLLAFAEVLPGRHRSGTVR